MADPVDRLRLDPSTVADVSPGATLDAVVARGRRRLAIRRIWQGMAAVVIVVGAFAALGDAPDGPTYVDSAGDPGAQDRQTADTSARAGAATSTAPTSTATEVVTPPDATSSSTVADEGGTRRETAERVELQIVVTTDATRYARGEPVTVTIEACNTSERDAVEYFANADQMFRVRMVSDDDRTVALGFHGRDGDPVQVWVPDECRRYAMTWDQREGDFGETAGQQAWPGEYTARVDWFSTDPPPPGMDPGLYDPAPPERRPAISAVFRIEEPDPGADPPLLEEL